MRPGVSISVTFGKYNDVPYDRWVFVRNRDIESHNIGINHVDRKNNRNIMRNSLVVNKTFYDEKRRSAYVAGPSREEVQKITGRTIIPVTLHERDKPGQNISNDQIQIYRPRIQKNRTNNILAPREVVELHDVKNISFRDSKKPTAVNFSDNLLRKDKAYQTPNLKQPRKGNRILRVPQPEKNDSPIKNDKPVQVQKPLRVNSPINENRIDRSKEQINNPPKKNNRNSQPQKEQNVNSATGNSAQNKVDDHKKENRK